MTMTLKNPSYDIFLLIKEYPSIYFDKNKLFISFSFIMNARFN